MRRHINACATATTTSYASASVCAAWGCGPKKRISDKALDEASLPTEAEEDMTMIDGGREEGGNE